MNIDIEQFADRYVAVWNEADPVARRSAIAALWAADGVQITESAEHRGHDELEARISEAHAEFVRGSGLVFRPADDVTGHHGAVVFTTHLVPADGGDITWTGRVCAMLGADGRIRSEHQFTVPAAGGSTRAGAEEFLRRLAGGDPDRIADLFAEEVDWVLDWPSGGHPAVPWIRPRSTRAEVAEHFRAIADFHVPEKAAGSASRVLVEGQDAVVLGDIRQTVRATGRSYTALCALHLTFGNGLITRYAVYEDSLSVAEALGGS
ncbi:Ketosteroid isomerase-related protein [Saccharopolyspora antimicrobica]|uniref:Ketosteroid isomerase-like protein n=1 Tax=Saccharopolyspora antimicrobica TaxID=455193 RepID=A0A1I5HDC2_9PSEU|nr:nuclear transport factor 2 family protein [Saccharopolyspora antimicrobica]RKT85368.1 ketosteroid isomerase-like protein [Saccharopolyspora antimicrobica]SFO46060.1 Ketosteroid isomerase-related protein [Saccharopolyspora antimicrobica]